SKMEIYSPPRYRNGVMKNQLKSEKAMPIVEKRKKLKKLSQKEKSEGISFFERLKALSFERMRNFFIMEEELP
ncbi:MAG: hypothetical protein V2A54_03965, partial [Bacteroidota bacterium]